MAKRTLKGMAAGLLIMLVFLMIFAFIIVYTPFPYDMSGAGVIAAMMAGTFAGGIFSSAGMQSRGWLRGIVCGAGMLAVLIIIGIAVCGGAVVQSGLFKAVVLCIVSAAAGGVAGINIRIKK